MSSSSSSEDDGVDTPARMSSQSHQQDHRAKTTKKKRRHSSTSKVIHRAFRYITKGKKAKLRRLLSNHKEVLVDGDVVLQELLHAACTHPHGADIVHLLLRRGARADVPSPTSGRTAAHVAAAAGCLELLAILMGHASAPDMDVVDKQGHSVFDYTVRAMERQQQTKRAGTLRDATRPNTNQEDAWEDKLAGAWSDPEGHATYMGSWADVDDARWGVPADAQPEAAREDDDWADSIRHQYEAKRAAQRAQHAAAWRDYREEGAKKRKEASEAAYKHSQRILEEERARDRAWRDAVADAGAVQTRAAYQTRWLALVSAPPPQLTMQDIPWLVAEGGPSGGAPGQVGGPHGLRAVVLHGVPADDHVAQKRRVREELLRWHPDKFAARFSSRLPPAESDVIMQRVKHTSQLLNELHASIQT